jgi:N-acylneuraminate cytidylyltransferase
MAICIIPAKGDSVGIPRKNFSLVGNVPLIERAVMAAKQSEYVIDTYVVSESEEMREIAEKHGVNFIKEPDTHFPTSEDCLAFALEQIGKTDGNMVFLQCTSPFTTGAEIDACITLRHREGKSCVFTVKETHSGVWTEDFKGEFVCLNHDKSFPRKPRQKAGRFYIETGGIYAMSIPAFLNTRTRFCNGDCGYFVVSEKSSIEIDNPFDLNIARAVGNTYEKVAFKEACGEACKCNMAPVQWPGGFKDR